MTNQQEDFEIYAKNIHWDMRMENGRYIHPLTQARWETWKFLAEHEKKKNEQALREATHIATWMFERWFSQEPEYANGKVTWKPLDDLCGVLSQIDNMIAGFYQNNKNPLQTTPLLQQNSDKPGGALTCDECGVECPDPRYTSRGEDRHIHLCDVCHDMDESTPNQGWLRAIDEELTATHLGVADVSDTYEEAKIKLFTLIKWHISVAIDPAVNGGWKLVPINPTQEMLEKGANSLGNQIDGKPAWKCNVHTQAEHQYKAMLDSAPKCGE